MEAEIAAGESEGHTPLSDDCEQINHALSTYRTLTAEKNKLEEEDDELDDISETEMNEVSSLPPYFYWVCVCALRFFPLTLLSRFQFCI